MSRMIRKQVYVEPEHAEILKRKAKELGTTESGVIRLGIERLDQTAHSPEDRKAWAITLDLMRARVERLGWTGPAPEDRGWTRDDLHDRHEPWTYSAVR